MPATTNDRAAITAEEAAKRLGVSTTTMRRYINGGRIPYFYQNCHKVMIIEADFEKFFADLRRPRTAKPLIKS